MNFTKKEIRLSKEIKDLVPEMQQKASDAVIKMSNDTRLKYWGVECVAISETKRELTVQMAYYSRGRMQVCDVQKMYAAAGLYAISENEAKIPNTWTLRSKHIVGKAIDIVPVVNGKLTWNVPVKVWERMGEIGKECGLNWGGDWKEKDYPHFEID